MTLTTAFVTLLMTAWLASTTLLEAPRCNLTPSGAAPGVALEPVASGFSAPLYVAHAGDGSKRLFVVEKNGLIRVLDQGKVLDEAFLDVSDMIVTVGEQGLLSMAFHPDYAENGRFFVYYSATGEPRSVIAEYRVSDNPDRAGPEGRVILEVPQPPTAIHKAGQLQFGPDGYLYIGLGDGGAASHAQDLGSLLGKILRIDIDVADAGNGAPYRLPPDNPFLGVDAARGEIWAYGLRNPWRFSFDMCTTRLFAGDVGAGGYEEVNLVEAGNNYGWAMMEANTCTDLGSSSGRCDETSFTKPLHAYAHLQLDPAGGKSIIGGYVYRGSDFPALAGRYLFADLVSSRIWTLTESEAGLWERDEVWQRAGTAIVSFGEDEKGELYVVSINNGTLERVVPDTTTP
jgi:glucose/arabinose dehydrogenase